MARLRVPVQLRWSDMDAYGHVDIVEMLRLLEEARIEAFWRHPTPRAEALPMLRAESWPTAVLDAGPGSGHDDAGRALGDRVPPAARLPA